MNLRVLVSVSAATNCRYFFISVVWSTTVGLGAGTKAMLAAEAERAAEGRNEADRSLHRSHWEPMYAVGRAEKRETLKTTLCGSLHLFSLTLV